MGDPYMPTEAKTIEHGTPPSIFEPLDAEFGFTLDAAATADNALCPAYYTKEEDGTQQPWAGHIVWCNPPWGASDLRAFTQKAIREVASRVLIALHVPAKTDQPWFHWLWARYEAGIWRVEFRWIRGRVKYLGNKDAAPLPSLTVILGPKGAA
ncbi:MAG: hypothetical protein A2Y61_00410 [Chloroflexi bacterium RBG_13_60_13]|nr:MAG: hypothetical protein A2Y61_00410 [Chloroflexi bacterium RBG_13_60_13]